MTVPQRRPVGPLDPLRPEGLDGRPGRVARLGGGAEGRQGGRAVERGQGLGPAGMAGHDGRGVAAVGGEAAEQVGREIGHVAGHGEDRAPPGALEREGHPGQGVARLVGLEPERHLERRQRRGGLGHDDDVGQDGPERLDGVAEEGAPPVGPVHLVAAEARRRAAGQDDPERLSP